MAIYWTVQPIERFKELQDKGLITGLKEGAMFPKAYEWLVDQMDKRIEGNDGRYPIWLWTEFPKEFRSYYPKGVVLKVEIPDEKVLLSNFDAWHNVINNTYFCLTDEEWDATEESDDVIVNGVSKEDSWLRIFNILEGKVQGTTPVLTKDMVKKTIRFVGKIRKHY